jgi:hypothetical protein
MDYLEVLKYDFECTPIRETMDFLKDFDGNKADRVCETSQKISKEVFDEQLEKLLNWPNDYEIAYILNGERKNFSADESLNIVNVLIDEIKFRK